MEKNKILDKLEAFNEQLNLTHYWILFLKYKRLLIFMPALFGLLGYLIGLNIKPLFQSHATLVIEKEQKKVVDIEEVYSTTTGFSDFSHVNNQIQIIKSDEILNRVLADEETIKKFKNLLKCIPDKFVSKNIKA